MGLALKILALSGILFCYDGISPKDIGSLWVIALMGLALRLTLYG